MSGKERVRRWAQALLGVTALCSAALFFCAGDSAVRVFSQQKQAEKAASAAPHPALLQGLRVAVDAGHGGYDGGAVGRVSGVAEKGLNLDVALKVRRLLIDQGAEVIMTRTDDYALCDENPPIRKKLQDMQRRAAMITGGGADVLLSIHMNEYAGRSQSGPQLFYREGCPAGRLLAGAVQQAMNEALAPKKERSALGGDYYILTLGIPGVLVECGFLSNREEEALLLDDRYRQRVAEAIVQGVMQWALLPGEKPQPLPAVDRSHEPKGE